MGALRVGLSFFKFAARWALQAAQTLTEALTIEELSVRHEAGGVHESGSVLSEMRGRT